VAEQEGLRSISLILLQSHGRTAYETTSLKLSNRSRGLCPNINKDRQKKTPDSDKLRLHVGCRSEPFRWESKSAARFATGPATCREELPGRTSEPSAVVSRREHKSWDSCRRCCCQLVLRLPAVSPCVSALEVRLWRFEMRSPPGEGANRDLCLC
jgi:hypothetical protein